MCSHGESGLKRWLFGSVSHAVTRKSSIPMLVLNEYGQQIATTHVAHLV